MARTLAGVTRVDDLVRGEGAGGAVAGEGPGERAHLRAEVEAAVGGEDRAFGEVGEAEQRRRAEALGVQHAVHRRRAGRGGEVVGPGPGGGEGLSVRPAAVEAGAVAGGERRRLVEEEDLGVTRAHHRAPQATVGGQAAYPGPAAPARPSEPGVRLVEAAAAVAHEEAALGHGVQRPVRGTAVLQGRGSRHRGGAALAADWSR